MHYRTGLLHLVVLFWMVVGGALRAQDLHQPPNCGSGFASTLMEFSTGGVYDWTPAGTLSQTYPNAGFSGHDVTFTVSGNTGSLSNSPGTGQLTPSLDGIYSGFHEALSLYTTGIGNGNNITLQVTFSPAIPGDLGFDIYHVNRSGSGDKIQVTATTQSGTNLNPSFTFSANPTYSQIGLNTLNAHSFTAVADGQVGVNFQSADSIASVTLVWTDCNGCGAANHGIAFGDFEFCRRFADNDKDGIEDQVDVDDDNDGIPDVTEACANPYANPDQDTIEVEILLDGYPDETTWRLEDTQGNTLIGGGPYNRPLDIGTTIRQSAILDADQAATFRIFDSYGDALTYVPAGSFTLRKNGVVLVGPIVDNWGFSRSEFIPALGAPYNGFACLGTDFAADDDKDGLWNYQDPDYCTLNAAGVCASLDLDGDGTIDPFDLDSDNDGIPDNIEGQGSSCFVPAGNTVDANGLPLAFVTYANCADNSSATTYGIVPNQDADDGDATPDYQDLDTDGDGVPDYAEGFDFDGDAEAYDDYMGFAAGFVAGNGSVAAYPATDSDGDLIPDWLDNLPAVPGFDDTRLPPFQDPASPFYFDTDNDGVVDLFDSDHGGSPAAYPPDSNADGDPDWRDIDNNSSLPVAWISFEAFMQGKEDARLEWNTGQESGISHYEVYRSANGLSFGKIGEVAAVNGSENHYGFVDWQVARSFEKEVYYKVMGFSVDGTIQTTEIRKLSFTGPELELSLEAFPNPFFESTTLRIGGEATEVEIAVYDMLGKQVLRQSLAMKGNVELVPLELKELESGMYLVVLESKGEQRALRLLKQ